MTKLGCEIKMIPLAPPTMRLELMTGIPIVAVAVVAVAAAATGVLAVAAVAAAEVVTGVLVAVMVAVVAMVLKKKGRRLLRHRQQQS